MIFETQWRHAMPIIKLISDLRNKTNHVSDLLHKSHESVFITRNGEGDMVLMSLAKYGEMERTLERYEKPAVADPKETTRATPHLGRRSPVGGA
jgi:prevent-host-death family protein